MIFWSRQKGIVRFFSVIIFLLANLLHYKIISLLKERERERKWARKLPRSILASKDKYPPSNQPPKLFFSSWSRKERTLVIFAFLVAHGLYFSPVIVQPSCVVTSHFTHSQFPALIRGAIEMPWNVFQGGGAKALSDLQYTRVSLIRTQGLR